MKMQEKAVKVILDERDAPIGIAYQNGTLKFYKLVEITYEGISELFDQK